MVMSLTKFLTNMLLSGVVTQDKGINYMWHNPFLFFLSRPYASFYNTLYKSIPNSELKEIFHWMGLLQGRNSTRMFKNRAGFDKSDFGSFINGATIIGMGELNLKEYDKEGLKWGYIEGTSSTFAKRLKEINKSIKKPVDDYLCGILAGGAEVLFDVKANCNEEQCMISGKDKCIYKLEADKEYNFKFLQRRIPNFEELDKTISAHYLKKKAFVKVSLKKKFSFSNGAFYFNKLEGYNMEAYLIYLLDTILRTSHPKEYKKALEVLFEQTLKELNVKRELPFSKENILRVYKEVEIIGFGELRIKNTSKNIIFLESENSVIAEEYKNIFGKGSNTIDNLFIDFLEVLIKYSFNKKVKIEETACISRGDRNCTYKLEYS